MNFSPNIQFLHEWTEYLLAHKVEVFSVCAMIAYVGFFLWWIRRAERDDALRRQKSNTDRSNPER